MCVGCPDPEKLAAAVPENFRKTSEEVELEPVEELDVGFGPAQLLASVRARVGFEVSE